MYIGMPSLNVLRLKCYFPLLFQGFQLIDQLPFLIRFDKRDSTVETKFQQLIQKIRKKSSRFW